MPKFWEDFSKWLEDASKVISKEAGDLTLKGKLKLEIFDLKRRLKEKFAELGSIVYECAFFKKNEKWRKYKQVKAIVQRIKGLQRHLKIKETDYKNIGKQKIK